MLILFLLYFPEKLELLLHQNVEVVFYYLTEYILETNFIKRKIIMLIKNSENGNVLLKMSYSEWVNIGIEKDWIKESWNPFSRNSTPQKQQINSGDLLIELANNIENLEAIRYKILTETHRSKDNTVDPTTLKNIIDTTSTYVYNMFQSIASARKYIQSYNG